MNRRKAALFMVMAALLVVALAGGVSLACDTSGPSGSVDYTGNTAYPYPVIVRAVDGSILSGSASDADNVASVGPMIFTGVVEVGTPQTAALSNVTGLGTPSVTYDADISGIAPGAYVVEVPMEDSCGNANNAALLLAIV